MPSDEKQEAEKIAQKPVDWKDYRDHLATADQEGHRMWLYPRKPCGSLYRGRTWFSWLLLFVMFVGPFVRIGGNPLLLMNIVERKFVIAGQIFWPQDTFLFALAMLIFITGIIIFTAVFGRLWCGWACPQTVLMEMVFRKIEYLIEGDAHKQKALDKAPWDARKFAIKGSKHAIFFALSWVVGNTLLAYIVGTEKLYQIITDNPLNHLSGLGAMIVFTLIFYGIFARFREQACTFICPYGRFQSTLLDENTIVVAYDHKRGEGRGKLKRLQGIDERKASGLGDCVDCHQCVTVCPTGIDIRNGTQMECVNCTACIDACNAVMTKINRPQGLIRYASLNGIEKGEKLRVTPRLIGYSVILCVLTVLMSVLLVTRSDVETSLLRAPGTLYQTMPDGNLSNLYLIKLTNKTTRDIPIDLKIEDAEGSIQIVGKQLHVPAQSQAETSVLIELEAVSIIGAKTPITVGVYSEGRLLESVKTAFIGPDNQTKQP